MVDAAAQGLGIAYVASWAAEAAFAESRLRTVPPVWMHEPERLAVYYPGYRAVPPALRAFLDVVRDVLVQSTSRTGGAVLPTS